MLTSILHPLDIYIMLLLIMYMVYIFIHLMSLAHLNYSLMNIHYYLVYILYIYTLINYLHLPNVKLVINQRFLMFFSSTVNLHI